MINEERLRNILSRIDGKSYNAYRDIQGQFSYRQEGFDLIIDHVQGDPYASPSRVRIVIDRKRVGFPAEKYPTKSHEVALCDFLTRSFARAIFRFSQGHRGSGKSGRINIDVPGQEILERTSVQFIDGKMEVRFTVGLPAFGRRIAGEEAMAIFFDEIPVLIEEALHYNSIDKRLLQLHIDTNVDADFLRSKLDSLGLVAFVANQAILPRKSGVEQLPLDDDVVIPFSSPRTLEMSVKLPNAGKIWGMGIPKGITLIVGGGFHGKSTLLQAIERGVYNHRSGDGREKVITDPTAFKVRAEDGRSISSTDISPFINNLPYNKSTHDFSTQNASGSTSQAANIIEAVEAEAKVLLIDEDTSATNFMIRDRRMQELILKDKEPITPLVDKIRSLYDEHNVSSILVMGGSGDYLEQADVVLTMEEYVPLDVTIAAKKIAAKYATNRNEEGGNCFGLIKKRIPISSSIVSVNGKNHRKIKATGTRSILYGTNDIDLDSIEQLVDESQTRAISEAIAFSTRYMDGKRSMVDVARLVFSFIEAKGLGSIGNQKAGNFSLFRMQEFMAALNRLRSIEMKDSSKYKV